MDNKSDIDNVFNVLKGIDLRRNDKLKPFFIQILKEIIAMTIHSNRSIKTMNVQKATKAFRTDSKRHFYTMNPRIFLYVCVYFDVCT